MDPVTEAAQPERKIVGPMRPKHVAILRASMLDLPANGVPPAAIRSASVDDALAALAKGTDIGPPDPKQATAPKARASHGLLAWLHEEIRSRYLSLDGFAQAAQLAPDAAAQVLSGAREMTPEERASIATLVGSWRIDQMGDQRFRSATTEDSMEPDNTQGVQIEASPELLEALAGAARSMATADEARVRAAVEKLPESARPHAMIAARALAAVAPFTTRETLEGLIDAAGIPRAAKADELFPGVPMQARCKAGSTDLDLTGVPDQYRAATVAVWNAGLREAAAEVEIAKARAAQVRVEVDAKMAHLAGAPNDQIADLVDCARAGRPFTAEQAKTLEAVFMTSAAGLKEAIRTGVRTAPVTGGASGWDGMVKARAEAMKISRSQAVDQLMQEPEAKAVWAAEQHQAR